MRVSCWCRECAQETIDHFRVVHLTLTRKKGMSAVQIRRYTRFGSDKTAWETCHEVRVALMERIEKRQCGRWVGRCDGRLCGSHKAAIEMVGATGIEPVTPPV